MDMDPVEYVIIEFPEHRFTGSLAPAIEDLVARDVVRILDLVFLRKDRNGAVSFFDPDELEDLSAYVELEGEAEGLMSDEELTMMTDALEPDTAAMCIVWEHRWAGAFGRAIRASGSRLVAGERLSDEMVRELLEDED